MSRRAIDLTSRRNKFSSQQTITEFPQREPGSIQVGVDPNLWINNPVFKKTKTGHLYIEHKQLAANRKHPNCFCFDKTYLYRTYFKCENCEDIHFVLCDQSPYENEEEADYDSKPECNSCRASDFYRQKFAKKQNEQNNNKKPEQ